MKWLKKVFDKKWLFTAGGVCHSLLCVLAANKQLSGSVRRVRHATIQCQSQWDTVRSEHHILLVLVCASFCWHIAFFFSQWPPDTTHMMECLWFYTMNPLWATLECSVLFCHCSKFTVKTKPTLNQPLLLHTSSDSVCSIIYAFPCGSTIIMMVYQQSFCQGLDSNKFTSVTNWHFGQRWMDRIKPMGSGPCVHHITENIGLRTEQWRKAAKQLF